MKKILNKLKTTAFKIISYFSNEIYFFKYFIKEQALCSFFINGKQYFISYAGNYHYPKFEFDKSYHVYKIDFSFVSDIYNKNGLNYYSLDRLFILCNCNLEKYLKLRIKTRLQYL